MPNWDYLNKHRVTKAQDEFFGSDQSYGFNGAFCFTINALPVKCIVSDGRGWKHVSVSIAGSNIPPSWSIMSQVKDLFWDPEDWVCQFHPAHSQYVNMNDGVLHLWQPLNEKLPTPDRLMVGIKDEAGIDRLNADPASPYKVEKL